MKTETALIELSFHSCRNSATNDPRWINGFLGSMRPFQSMALVEKNFHKVMNCLRALTDFIANSDVLDKGLVSDVSGIICFGYAWGVNGSGMLRYNKLVTPEQSTEIEKWIECISYAWTTMLDSGDEDTAFEIYDTEFSQHNN